MISLVESLLQLLYVKNIQFWKYIAPKASTKYFMRNYWSCSVGPTYQQKKGQAKKYLCFCYFSWSFLPIFTGVTILYCYTVLLEFHIKLQWDTQNVWGKKENKQKQHEKEQHKLLSFSQTKECPLPP